MEIDVCHKREKDTTQAGQKLALTPFHFLMHKGKSQHEIPRSAGGLNGI